jgi:hypothetical protein
MCWDSERQAALANHVYTSDYYFSSFCGLPDALLTDVEDALKALGS